MSNENISTEQIYKTSMIIWLALFSSQFIFIVVGYFLNPNIFSLNFTKPISADNLPIILAFAFFSIVNLIISFVMKKNMLQNAVEHQNPNLVQTAMLIACALCESISLFGLVLAIAFDFQFFFVFFLVGIIGMLFHFPKRESLHLATYKKSQNI